MVSVKVALPAVIEAGLTLVIVGGGWDTVKLIGADVPPMVVAVMATGPAVVTRLAGTVNVKLVLPTKVPGNGVDPQLTTIGKVKYSPKTLNVKLLKPAGTWGMLMAVRIGGGGITVKGKAGEIFPAVVT